jgi:hypothetical protein
VLATNAHAPLVTPVVVAVLRAARKLVGVGYDPGGTVYVLRPIVIVL